MIKEVVEKKDWLLSSIESHIKSFKKRKQKNKKKAFYSKITISSFSMLITILLGINLIVANSYLKIISITLAIFVTLISTINLFFDYSNLWVKYTESLNKLYEIRDDLDYYLVGKGDYQIESNIMDEFKTRLNKILDETNNSWLSLKK